MKSKAFIVALCALLFVQAKAQELLNYPLDTVNGEEVYRYQVEKSIGLYRVGVNFNVPQSEIIRLNPQLRERGLHYEEILLLPTGRKVEAKREEVNVKREEVRDSVIPEIQDTVVTEERDTVVVTTDTVVAEPDNRRVVELALMLPFESQQTKRSGNAERMMEFYQGALLALQNLQNDSILYRLRVYDTERSERRVQALSDSTELDSVRAILGLVYPIQIERMASWCAAHQVPLLLPFSNDMDLASHPYVMQFNSTDQQEADSLCNWLESHKEDVHVVLTEVKEADLSSSVRTLRKQMKARGIDYTALPLHDLMNDSAAYAMNPEKENLIVLHSDRYQQIRILLPHIMTLRHVGYRVRLMSRYAWQKEQIELPQVYTSMFTQNADKEAYDALWEQTYKTNHTSEHPRYDLLGYDLMQALVQVVRGNSEPMNGLQSTIQWKQVQQGGYQNACVGVIAY
jgi:hypothetical protein